MSDTYDRLTQLAVELTGASAAVLTTGSDPDRFVLSAHGRVPEAIRPGTRLPLTRSMGGCAVESGRRLVIADARTEPEWSECEPVTDWKLVAYAGVPLLTETGEVVAVLSVFDYEPRAWQETSLRALEAVGEMTTRQIELQRSRDLAALLMEHAGEGAIIVDGHGTLRYSSSISRTVFGYAPGELLGQSVLDLVHPDDRDAALAVLAALASAPGTKRNHELRARHKDGQWRTAAIAGINRTDDATIQGIVVYMRDVTEQRAAQEALRKREERFRALTEHAHDVVGIIALDGTILYESPAVESILGWTPEELEGRAASEVIHPDDRATVADAISRIANDPRAVISLKYRVQHRNGSYRTLDARAWNAVHIPAVGGIVVNARDVTGEEALASQLRQAQKMEAVGRLAGGVAHDFNNVLTVISARTTFAREDLPSDSPAQSELAEVEAATQRAAKLTRQLLAFGRQQVLHPQSVDLSAVVRDIARMLDRTLGDDIETIVDVAPNPVPTWADPTQLEQVLVNLAVNARDAMPRGGTLTLRTNTVSITPATASRHPGLSPGTYAALIVRDTGTGMDAETQARMFEPFFTTKAAGKGTGLGLATVYGIVKQSGGYVAVESAPGEGSTFTVMLPPAPGADAEEPRTPARKLAQGRGTVLLVEDDPAVRLLVRRMLERGGYTVVEAANGSDALAVLEAREHDVDLLLTDAVMPVMSARDLVPRARACRPRLKVLVMTGYSDDAVASHGEIAEDAELIAKPFSSEELLGRVARELAPRR